MSHGKSERGLMEIPTINGQLSVRKKRKSKRLSNPLAKTIAISSSLFDTSSLRPGGSYSLGLSGLQ